jgi:hypothetical protein
MIFDPQKVKNKTECILYLYKQAVYLYVPRVYKLPRRLLEVLRNSDIVELAALNILL